MKLHRNMTNLEIAELLRAIAAAYQLKGEDRYRFKIIAYQRAADAVEHASSELKDLWDDGKLEEVPSIGKSIAGHLNELFSTGRSLHFEKVTKGLPKAVFELMEVPGIGAKTSLRLVKELGLKSLNDLEKAAKSGRIASLEGFGEQSQGEMVKAIRETRERTKRLLLPYAATLASEVIDWMLKNKKVKRADTLGSLRRQASTVGDIDIAASTDYPGEVISHFTAYPKAQRVIEKGEKTASIIVPGGVQVDLMVQSPQAYGALLQHFTGSKHHNIALREYALKKGLSLSEYGIKNLKGKDKKIGKFADEEAFYGHLGLDFIPPELREDSGEIEAAVEHKLPLLVELKQIKGDLQIHSSFDIETSHDLGESSMQEVVDKAEELGYEYVAFTEHNPSKSRHSENQIVDILRRKREAVDKLNYSIVKRKYKSVKKVFNSLEIDILPDGGLPVSDRGLKLLDFALISIHSSFHLSREKMTKRIISSFSNPKIKIFAHPTARKINFREGVEINWEEVFDFCLREDKWLEINAEPMRLDLPDVLVREAVKKGVKLTLGTDAHHKDGLNNMVFGVSVARRGWAQKDDIVNTRSLPDFEKMIK